MKNRNNQSNSFIGSKSKYLTPSIVLAVLLFVAMILFFAIQIYRNKIEALYQYVDSKNADIQEQINQGNMAVLGPDSPYNSCDDIDRSCVIFNSKSNDQMTLMDFPFTAPGWLITYEQNGNNLQFAYNWSDQSAKFRVAHFGEWLPWNDLFINQDCLLEGSPTYLQSCNLNDVIRQNKFYLLVDDQQYGNMPLDSLRAGFLQVQFSGNWTMQTFYHLTDHRIWKRSFMGDNEREPGWVLINNDDKIQSLQDSEDSIDYAITQNINRDSIYNTYILSSNPSISYNSSEIIEAIDNESTSIEEATDMTAAIMLMLKTTGHCKLGPGTFYVSGNIDLPFGACLEGCGYNTIVRLFPDTNSGYITRILQNNTVRGIRFSGGKSSPANLLVDDSNFGLRNGIVFTGNADGEEESRSQALTNIITDCWFENFDGAGFYGHNTGGGIANTVSMSDCFIRNCRVGINIDYYMEYSKFTSCIINSCYYACINNGGNNVFTGCTFHGVVGWMCDNTNQDKRNNTHGSCIGCTFNHINNINRPDILGRGSAIIILNGNSGYVFSGCQFWYGNIVIDNSRAISFSDCLFGNSDPVITVSGDDWGVFFHDNTFFNKPVLHVNSKTRFVDCFTSDGSLVEP